MERGNLIIYDSKGKIWYQSGEADGDILPHVYPVGIPYIEIPYGTITNKRIVSIDVSVTHHVPITEDIEVKPTYEELENQLLLNENNNVDIF
ncbi:hypothetical protein [Vallitalea maricola]|uniref:Uncharacterized protein n=1 Tax=Vallitalea maricola TaxID=3074433 RepID=A0ACB5UHB2_9FIRM|nr:hypothetical protein AN2V17_15840 [Vallitalea sp. AN17-2]